MRVRAWLLALGAALALTSGVHGQSRPPAQKTGPITIYGTGSTGDISTMSAVPSASAPAGSIAKLLANTLPPTLTGPPAVSGTFRGGAVPAKFGQNVDLTAASTTLPELGLQAVITSNVGNGDMNAYKIGIFSAALGGVSSAPTYGINTIAQGHAGAGGYLVTSAEFDLNNIGAPAGEIGSNTAAYGIVTVAAGTTSSTAGLWITAALDSTSFDYGVAVTFRGATKYAFFDGSQSIASMRIEGSHTSAIDASGATLNYGMVLKNGVNAIFQQDAQGAFHSLIRLAANSNLAIGDAGHPAVEIASPLVLYYGGTPQFVQKGPADGCGTGFACLRVAN